MNHLRGGQGRDPDDLNVDAVNLFWPMVIGTVLLWILALTGL